MPTPPWSMRWLLIRAIICLAIAKALVRFVPFTSWRRSLGIVLDPTSPDFPTGPNIAGDACVSTAPPTCDDATLRHAMLLGRLVDRAAEKLPGTSKCLPRAAALQWMLRRAGISSSLVIAFRLQERSGPHAYHAWTEVFGEMLVGHCDRAEYRPIMALRQTPPN